ncbi:unnamed protein product, partial [marine sediment metagenome]
MQRISKIKKWIGGIYEGVDKRVLIAILAVMILSTALRAYNFSEWLLVRADQARDATIARQAFENGPANLRILGPKVDKVKIEGDVGAGDTFNLGPFYYYIQYASMVILGSADPSVVALPDLIMSILTIPLFYIFLRQVFSKRISFIVTTLFSFSFILIQYSRFAWNPNQLFFWSILFVLGLYKTAVEKNKSRAGWWLVA